MSMDRPSGASLVRPRLLLGNYEDALRCGDLRVSHVLSAVAGWTWTAPEGVVHKRIELEDEPGADILACLPAAVEFIETALASSPDASILVHCMAGVSRSASIVVAYLMRAERLSLTQAMAEVRAARPIIEPNPGFRRQLGYFELMHASAGAAGGGDTGPVRVDSAAAKQSGGGGAGSGVEEAPMFID